MSIQSDIRPPAVAGYFYEDDAVALQRDVQSHLSQNFIVSEQTPKAIIVPHAGYIYSGVVAGKAYSQFLNARQRFKTVILLGPAHRVALNGLAVPSVDAFDTPLGEQRLGKGLIKQLLNNPDVIEMDEAHAQEHSLEVQIPFLQTVFDDFQLVPVVVGDASPDTVAGILQSVWADKDTLIVISTDLSHFHHYDLANEVDNKTAEAIHNFDITTIGPHQACGCRPLNGLLSLAKKKNLKMVNYALQNSADTAGDRDRVVGYGAWGLYE